MLYRFQSRETADVLMFQKDAERVLTILGKDPSAPGVIIWQDLPEAITRLKAEAELERAAAAATPQTLEASDSEDNEPATPTGTTVQLHQRISPLVKAMERCHAARKDVIWTI